MKIHNSSNRNSSSRPSSRQSSNRNSSSNSRHDPLELRPVTAPAGNNYSRRSSNGGNNRNTHTTLDPINTARSQSQRPATSGGYGNNGNNIQQQPISVWGTYNRPKTAPGFSKICADENIRQKNILRALTQQMIDKGSSSSSRKGNKSNRPSAIDTKLANSSYEKGKEIAKYFSKDIELIHRIIKEIMKGEMGNFDNIADALNHSLHSTSNNNDDTDNKNDNSNSNNNNSSGGSRSQRMARLAATNHDTIERALSTTDLKLRLEGQLQQYRNSPLLLDELCNNIKNAKRKRKLLTVGKNGKTRPSIPKNISQMIGTWSMEEKAYFVRGMLGSPEGNKEVAKFWDKHTQQGLYEIRVREYEIKVAKTKRNRALQQELKMKDMQEKDWQLRLQLKLENEKKLQIIHEKQIMWLPIIFVTHRFVCFQKAIKDRKERMALSAKMNKFARKITNTLRYYCLSRFRKRISDLREVLNVTLVYRVGWWKLKRRIKAANVLQNYLIALKEALAKFGTSKNMNNKGAKITKYHKNVCLVQGLWRTQIKLKLQTLDQARLVWDRVFENLVAERVKELYKEEMEALEPENNEIIQINKQRRLQNKSMFPLRKPRANDVLEREVRMKSFVPWDIEEEIIRGFYRKCKRIHGKMFALYIKELKIYHNDRLNGKKKRKIYIPFLGLIKEDPLGQFTLPLKPRMAYYPNEEETRVLILAGQAYMRRLHKLWDASTPSRDKKGRLVLKNLPELKSIGMQIAKDYRLHLYEEFEIDSFVHSHPDDSIGSNSLSRYEREKERMLTGSTDCQKSDDEVSEISL